MIKKPGRAELSAVSYQLWRNIVASFLNQSRKHSFYFDYLGF